MGHRTETNFRRWSRHARSALAFCLIVWPSIRGQIWSQELQPDRPLLELDLRSYGYKPRSAGRPDFLSLDFADTGHVLFGWTTLDPSNGEKKIGPLTPAPSHLHALILDIHSGRKENSHGWPTSTFLATISAVGKNEFLICTGEVIELVSRNFDLVRQQALSRFGPCSADNLSPSRRFFSVDTGNGQQFERSILDATTFHPVATWSSEATNAHFTDSLLAANCKPDLDPCAREFTGDWHPIELPSVDREQRGPKPWNFGFVNDSTVVFETRSELIGTTPQGSLVFRIELPKRHQVGAIATSRSGARFAFLDVNVHGSEVMDTLVPSEYQVVVYSLRQKTSIYARKVKGVMWTWLPIVERRCRFALSPDGNVLAIVDDGVLKVYRLPGDKS